MKHYFYKPVKPVDTVITRTLVESGLYGIVFYYFWYLYLEEVIINDISMLFITYIAIIIFSFGVGLFLMVSTFIYPSIINLYHSNETLAGLFQEFLSLNALPQWLRPYLSWNQSFKQLN